MSDITRMRLHVLFFIFTSSILPSCLAQKVADPCMPTDGRTEVFTSISESAAQGDEVYRVDISGNSSTVSLTTEANQYFTFNQSSRNIVVSGILDAETNTQPQLVVITCTDLSTVRTRTLQISVYVVIQDANDHSPEFVRTVYNLTIGEMTEVNSTIQTGVTATDHDATPDYNIIYYSIVNGPYKDYFLIGNPLSTDLTLQKQLDFETLPRFSISIMAMDQPKSGNVQFNSTCTLNIIVEDQDDQNPIFNSTLYRGLITNTTAVGSLVTISPPIYAYDPDLSLHAKVTYSFHGPEYLNRPAQIDQSHVSGGHQQYFDTASQSSPTFDIDPNTAKVTLVQVPTAEEIYLLVQATQVDNPSRYGVALLTIRVQGSNINAPVFSRNFYQMVVPEVFPIGQVVTAVFSTDKDSGSSITYSLEDPSKTFDIFSDTGDIILIKELSYVLKNSYEMTAIASDGTLESRVTVFIQVRPVLNTPPQFLNTSLNVTAERRQGEFIVDIDARDSGENSTLFYRLLNYNELFSINNEGIITITADPSALVLNNYEITVVVSNGGQPSYEKAAIVHVKFPAISAPVSAQIIAEDYIAVIVLAIVAALFLVIIIVLVVYICRRRITDEEHFDRAKKQHPSHIPTALTFKQKHGTLGQLGKSILDIRDEKLDDDNNVQENPLNSNTNGGYYNFVLGNSDTDVEADIQELQVDSQSEPQHSDTNNNNSEHIYNTSQGSGESEAYPAAGKSALTPFYRNGSVSTYRGSSGSDTSFSFSPSVSLNSKTTSKSGLVARTHAPEEKTSFWDRNKKSLPSLAAMPGLDSHSSDVPPQKKELTVYF